MKVIEAKNLRFTFPDGTRALNGVDLSVEEEENLGIIGPNGAGKTTLLLMLLGLLKGEGDIKILGKPLNNENLKFIRSKVGLVFQDPEDQLFMPTVFEDVSFGPLNMGVDEEEVLKRVNEALEIVGMKGKKDKMPHHLSLGEKKRIAIATVLAMEPKILLLDEPTSNLDPPSKRSLIGLLKELKITKIIASHDLELISEVCDRVIFMRDGRILKEVNISQIMEDQILMDFYGHQPFNPLLKNLKDVS
jgi:cobalt/nickel transport system ATP-binding protein